MQLFPVHSRILKAGDDLAAIIAKAGISDGDIVVVSSKAMATVENAFIDLRTMKPSAEAGEWSRKTGRSAEFCEAVLAECRRLRGKIIGSCPGAVLTEVQPDGLSVGTILTANAGLDQSNAPQGSAIGWPRDPVRSVSNLRATLGGNVGIILTDSCIRPRRLGVTAFALTVAGFDPLQSQAGRTDLFGRPLRITTEAVADQLATSANFLMGNAGQAVPAVIIRDHGIILSDFEGWVAGIPPADDLFRRLL